MYLLRELERKDLEDINRWRNDQKLIEQLGAPFRYINLDVDIMWYENYLANRSNNVRCTIVDEKDSFIGLVSLTGIDYLNQSAELHIMICDNKNQGNGAGTFAINAMLKHAFNNLNMQRIELTVLESNHRAQECYKKVGFKQEGVLRNACYKNGKFVNVYIFSILKEEFCETI
ncbi:MAG: GNAT family N-acetyltransferase [Lachnospiraceae bacterium]|nr:GNAT family N-acetyltransferase [Lachnospiraceae bacterium]